jgi:hypothetical protein
VSYLTHPQHENQRIYQILLKRENFERATNSFAPFFGRKKNLIYKISFHSSFLPSSNSNLGVSTFCVQTSAIQNWLFDRFSSITWIENNFYGRAGLLILSGYPMYYIFRAFVTTYSDFGHARVIRAFKGTPTYEDQYETYLGVLMDKILIRTLNTSYVTGQNMQSVPYFTETDRKLMEASSGLNNEMGLASDLGDRVYRYNSHVMDAIFYTRSKLNSWFLSKMGQPTPDMTNLSSLYQQKQNWSIPPADIKRGSVIAFFLSGDTYAYIMGVWNYAFYGDLQVKPLERWGFRLPAVSAYFTTKGLSYQVKSAYRASLTLYFPVGIEFITQGGRRTEVMLGMGVQFPKLWSMALEGKIYYSQALSAEARIILPFGQIGQIQIGGRLDDARTFVGERNSPRFSAKTPRTYTLWGSIGVLF